MTDHQPTDTKGVQGGGSDKSKRSGTSGVKKEIRDRKASKGDKKGKKPSKPSSSSNKKSSGSSSKSKLSRSGSSRGSKSKSRSSSCNSSSSSSSDTKSPSSAVQGKKGKEASKESQSKKMNNSSSDGANNRESEKEKEKGSKKEKIGSIGSLKKEAKKSSKSSKKDRGKERSKEKEKGKEREKASKNKYKSEKKTSSSKSKQKHADSKTSDSSKENTEKGQKGGGSLRRVSFDNNSLISHSSENSLDISGDISSGSEESFHLSNDEGSGTPNNSSSYDNSDLHASAVALPTVALKALQAMAALKNVEPANFKAEQKRDPSSCESPSRQGNSSRRASVSQANITALSPLVGGNPGQAAAQPGMDWEKLNRRLTYKHIKKPETKLETEKRMASEQTGKFFQLIQQQQHEGARADDPNLKLLTSAVEHRAKSQNFQAASATAQSTTEPQKRIPRSARIKKHQQPTQDDLDKSTTNSTKKLPPRVKSADPKLGRSLSALGSNRVRRNKSSDSHSQLSFESKGSKGSKGSAGSSKKSFPTDSSGRIQSMEESRSSHGDRAVRRKQHREAFHKSFSNHEHMRPSARRKKKAEDMTRSLNMSLSSGMNAQRCVRRHKSEEDYSFSTSASTQSRDRGGVRRNKSLEEESPNRSRAARNKFASSTNTRGIASSARRHGHDDDFAMDVSFDDDILALKDDDEVEDFRALVQQTDEFVSIHDLVKKEGKEKRFSIWD